MYFHNSLIPRGAYFLLPLESKQEATYSRGNFTKCISEVKVNQLSIKNKKLCMLKWAYPPLTSQIHINTEDKKCLKLLFFSPSAILFNINQKKMF